MSECCASGSCEVCRPGRGGWIEWGAPVPGPEPHLCATDGHGRCKVCGADEPPAWPVTSRHNHLTRDIKPKGQCPACDRHWKATS